MAVSRSPRIDPARPEPLYHQLETDLRERIASGEWPVGSQIPTETQLCEMYGVSRITVRHALRNLVGVGLLERGPGRGTFVRDPTLTAGTRGPVSFTTELAALGMSAGARVLDTEVVPAPDAVAEALDIEVDTPVYRIRRLRTGDGEPIGLQTAYVVQSRFPGLDRIDLADASLYDVLQERYGVAPIFAEETFRVRIVKSDEAALLGTEPNDAVFLVERVTHDRTGPYEVVHSVMRGDRYRIHLNLSIETQ